MSAGVIDGCETTGFGTLLPKIFAQESLIATCDQMEHVLMNFSKWRVRLHGGSSPLGERAPEMIIGTLSCVAMAFMVPPTVFTGRMLKVTANMKAADVDEDDKPQVHLEALGAIVE